LLCATKLSTEQEPTLTDFDASDEEGDFELSLETETGLLTNANQHGKGKEHFSFSIFALLFRTGGRDLADVQHFCCLLQPMSV
jgi:hypothetical protein